MSGNESPLDGGSPGVQPHLEWIDDTGAVNELWFDLVVDEDWPDEGADVTQHPVEVGADISDHVRVKLPTYQLTIRATNEPFTNAGPDGDLPVRGPASISYGKVKWLAVVHSHHSDEIRQLLCQRCNVMIGHCDDDIEVLRKAIAYLERHAMSAEEAA